jgi:hypothetical protein
VVVVVGGVGGGGKRNTRTPADSPATGARAKPDCLGYQLDTDTGDLPTGLDVACCLDTLATMGTHPCAWLLACETGISTPSPSLAIPVYSIQEQVATQVRLK